MSHLSDDPGLVFTLTGIALFLLTAGPVWLHEIAAAVRADLSTRKENTK
ncbi:hypothetical protein KRX56_06180 [Dermabacteraceae bacterium TAE3-ERU27]|nr:hypothetical protein [Dermabacteraceae bacterium TAE3-ERU27]